MMQANLGLTLPRDQQVIWVRANGVFGKGTNVVQPVNIPKLFAIWDYEGKYESNDWDRNDQ